MVEAGVEAQEVSMMQSSSEQWQCSSSLASGKTEEGEEVVVEARRTTSLPFPNLLVLLHHWSEHFLGPAIPPRTSHGVVVEAKVVVVVEVVEEDSSTATYLCVSLVRIPPMGLLLLLLRVREAAAARAATALVAAPTTMGEAQEAVGVPLRC